MLRTIVKLLFLFFDHYVTHAQVNSEDFVAFSSQVQHQQSSRKRGRKIAKTLTRNEHISASDVGLCSNGSWGTEANYLIAHGQQSLFGPPHRRAASAGRAKWPWR